jgi:hypothetical protein
MATAIQLNVLDTISSGLGLSRNGAIANEIANYQAQVPIEKIRTIYTTIGAFNSNANANLYSAMNSIGSGVTQAQWLIDHYPRTVTPKTSANLIYYGNSTQTPFSVSYSQVLAQQSNLPFADGLSGFANVFLTAYGHAQSVFDTVASVNLLQPQTYNDAGQGYTSPADLATGGLASTAATVIQTVNGWGTLYDVQNISTIGDPYVFGQNLLNQQLGKYGNWEANLALAGLDTTNLTAVPQSTTTIIPTLSSQSVNMYVGAIGIPTTANVPYTTVVTGNSPDVVLAIYANVTGANLDAIVTATGNYRPSTDIKSLADYLNFDRAIPGSVRNRLRDLRITNFSDLGQYLNKSLSSGSYRSWNEVVEFLYKINVPTYSTDQTKAPGTALVTSDVIGRILANTGTGTGELGQPIMSDFLGSCAGIPHAEILANINLNYGTVLSSSTLTSAMNSLESAVNTYITAYTQYALGLYINPLYPAPSIVPVQTAVTAVNSALNNVPSSLAFGYAEAAFRKSYEHLNKEVELLTLAGAEFGPASGKILQALASGIAAFASDRTQLMTYDFFQNIISNDAGGDNIQSAIAEKINTPVLTRQGISTNNDPNPVLAISQASNQNIPLTTYLSRNK